MQKGGGVFPFGMFEEILQNPSEPTRQVNPKVDATFMSNLSQDEPRRRARTHGPLTTWWWWWWSGETGVGVQVIGLEEHAWGKS